MLRLSVLSSSILVFSLIISGCSEQDSIAAPAEKAAAQAANADAADAPKPALRVETIGDNLHVIFGSGGNVGVSTGDDGVIIIDDKFSKNAAEILSTLKTLSDQPLRYVLNTHYHGDHTGSNIEMKETGATIMAHDNVRKRMGMTFENKAFGRTTKATDPKAWPTLTFSDTATLHFNGQQVDIIHTPSGHTDGDSIIKFVEANVIHMGDNFFNGLFPYIDVDGGGSLNGMIAAHTAALAMSDSGTQIIPGHGPMSAPKDLEVARGILITVKTRVEAGINAGKSADDLVRENILQDLSKYASFINEETMIRIAYRSLSTQ